MTHPTNQAFDGVRVLDLSDEKGAYGGKLLADMGADVIKVEPPQGDPMRRIGPFRGGDENPDRSLFFWHYNTNKRAITLDLADPQDQQRFRHLARTADVLLETFPPGTLARWGLSFAELRRVNPQLIMASLTGFGQTGPRRHWKTSDLVAQAAGGMLFVNGQPHEPPLRGFGLQAYHSGAILHRHRHHPCAPAPRANRTRTMDRRQPARSRGRRGRPCDRPLPPGGPNRGTLR